MSVEINENQFVTLDSIKAHFGFTDTQDDNTLLQIIQSANNEIKKQIVGVVDDISKIEQSKFFPRCVDAAIVFCEAEIRRQINQMYEQSDVIKKSFDDKIETLLEDMKAIAPVRTSRQVVSRKVDFEDEFFENRRFV